MLNAAVTGVEDKSLSGAILRVRRDLFVTHLRIEDPIRLRT